MKTILKALVGSHLYGLDTEYSDKDYLGVFVRPTRQIISLHPGEDTYVYKDPDFTVHEVQKFMWLAAKGNPTVMELLWVPQYELLTREGKLLVKNREAFLSNNIAAAFGGYAYQQAKKLEARQEEGLEGFNPAVKNRYAKHGRHCMRLLRQGKELMLTGALQPRLSNPEEYFKIGEMPPEELISLFEREYAEYKITVSILPYEPDWATLDKVLWKIRRRN